VGADDDLGAQVGEPLRLLALPVVDHGRVLVAPVHGDDRRVGDLLGLGELLLDERVVEPRDDVVVRARVGEVDEVEERDREPVHLGRRHRCLLLRRAEGAGDEQRVELVPDGARAVHAHLPPVEGVVVAEPDGVAAGGVEPLGELDRRVERREVREPQLDAR
jgi:hypothetical protein